MGTLGAVLVGAVMLFGLATTIVPFVPGLLIIWLAGLTHAVALGFDGRTWVMLAVLTVLALVGSAASLVLPHRGAAASGASRTGVAGGILGAVIGLVALPPLGLPIGAVLGVLVAERLRTGDLETAWRATKGALRGVGLGAVVEVSAGTLMIATWASWLLLT